MCPIEFFGLKGNQGSFLPKDSPNNENICVNVDSNDLVKFRNFNIVDKNFSFKSSNALCCSSFHSKDNSFLRRSENNFAFSWNNSFSWVNHIVVPPQIFLLLKAIKCSSYMKTSLIVKSFMLVWTLNGLVKFKNFNRRVDEKFFFKSSNAFCCSFFQLKDNFFLRRFESGVTICKNPLINF